MLRRCVLLLGLAACSRGPDSPYDYCRGAYEPVDANDDSRLGYSPQQVLDRLGLSHSGTLYWYMTENIDYPLVLPDETVVDLDLAVDKVRWGTYEVDTGGRFIMVDCPIEGLEILVTGTAGLRDYGVVLPVEGHVLAPRYDDRDYPSLEVLGLYVKGTLDEQARTPLMPTLDAFAQGEGFTYEDVTPSLLFGYDAWSSAAALQVSWTHEDAESDRSLPFDAYFWFEDQ